MRRTEAMKIIARVLRQPVEDVPKADLIYGRPIEAFAPGVTQPPETWGMHVDVLALRIAAALPLGDEPDPQASPLAQAEDAKRRRDIEGEIAALTQAGTALESAPWYPARPGDLVHIAYEQAGDCPPFGETYVIKAADSGLLDMQLLDHNCPGSEDEARGMVGCFANTSDRPLYEAWFEAGPHRLTIVRDGRPVHVGGAS